MHATERQRKVVNYLLGQRDFVTADQLAEHLGVSVRTVYRDMAAINDLAPVIQNTPSKGVRIDYRSYMESAAVLLAGSQSNGLTVVQRRRAIMLLLLFVSPKPYSVNKLSEIFFVNQSSIQQDLRKVSADLAGHNLELIAGNFGTMVVGSESAIRNALLTELAPLLGPLEDADGVTAPNEVAALQALDLVTVDRHQAIAEIIHAVEDRFDFRLENPEYGNLLCYLLILAERTRLADHGSEPPVSAGPAQPTRPDRLEGMSFSLVQAMASTLGLPVPQIEALPLHAFLFRTWSQDSQTSPDTAQRAWALAIGRRLLALLSEQLEVELDDPSLLEKLMPHLTPMLLRVEHGMQVHNPVLEQIRAQFPMLHAAVSTALQQCAEEFGLGIVSEAEAAYLVLYIQPTVEGQLPRRRKRVVVVCSTGRSTAYFLRNRLEENFPAWDLVDVLGTRELEARRSTGGFADVDLFVSTIPIEADQVPAVVVSPLLTERDIELIHQVVGTRGDGRRS